MPTIAVAGGTGGIGKAVVEELVRQGKYHVVILSRKASQTPIPGLSVEAIAADYTNPTALKDLLIKHNVETVISALMLATDESSQAQLNLINASITSGTVKTFIPSEYGIHYTPALAEFHPPTKYWLDASAALKASNLRYTSVILGWLLDYHGFPRVPSHMKPFIYVLDFANRRAVLPGDGTGLVSVLHSSDVARYIAAMLEQDVWPEVSAFASDCMSWGEMVGVAEEIMGEKWDVSYDSVETMEKGKGHLFEQPEGSYEGFSDEELRQMASEFGLMAVNGVMDVTGNGTRNAEFPDIKPITIREIVQKAWGKKED